MIYSEVRLHEKVSWILKKARKKWKKTKEQQESYQNANISYLCKEKFENKHVKEKNIVKLEIIVIKREYRGAAHSIWNLKYSVL